MTDYKPPLPFPVMVKRLNALVRRVELTAEEDEALGEAIRRAGLNRSAASQKLEAVGHFVRANEHLDAAKRELATGINTAATLPEMPAFADDETG